MKPILAFFSRLVRKPVQAFNEEKSDELIKRMLPLANAGRIYFEQSRLKSADVIDEEQFSEVIEKLIAEIGAHYKDPDILIRFVTQMVYRKIDDEAKNYPFKE